MRRKTTPAEMAVMVTFETLESFAREQVCRLLKSVLDEEARIFLGPIANWRICPRTKRAGCRRKRSVTGTTASQRDRRRPPGRTAGRRVGETAPRHRTGSAGRG